MAYKDRNVNEYLGLKLMAYQMMEIETEVENGWLLPVMKIKNSPQEMGSWLIS